MHMNDSQIALLVRKRAALLRQRARRISLYAISAGALASGGLLAISLLYFPTGAWERYPVQTATGSLMLGTSTLPHAMLAGICFYLGLWSVLLYKRLRTNGRRKRQEPPEE